MRLRNRSRQLAVNGSSPSRTFSKSFSDIGERPLVAEGGTKLMTDDCFPTLSRHSGVDFSPHCSPRGGSIGTIQRRNFLVAAGVLLGAPRAFAQAGKHSHIGYLSSSSRTTFPQLFARAMGELGWVEGRNLSIDWRFAEGVPERVSEFASELVNSGVQVMVAGSPMDPEVARVATRSIPIVALSALEPVRVGLAASLARPGGNVTGVLYADPTFAAKSVQLLKEALPGLKRVGIFYPDVRVISLYADAVYAASQSLNVTLLRFPIARREDIGAALALAKKQGIDALRIVVAGSVGVGMNEILAFTSANGIPTLWPEPSGVERGGFISYSPSLAELSALGASMVDKVLKGANPAEMPFQYPTRYEFVINLKTAKQLGIAVPQSILVRADRVIE
jgi:putative tryptophan/tyrosine transport system substrate-binding protein